MYHNYFVCKFESAVNELILNNNIEWIFYPSTIFIDERPEAYKEYTKAKLEGEKCCDRLSASSSFKVVRPRMPKILTDQTISILGGNFPDITTLVTPYLDQMMNS